MSIRLSILVALVLLAFQFTGGAVSAFDGPYYGNYGGACGYWPWLYPPVVSYFDEHVPYYALHPPVYYSYPVRHPYGFSPFANPPFVPRSEPAPRAPLTIRNPHVVQPASGPAEPGVDKAAVKPLRIVNPYVAQAGDPGVTPEAVMPTKPLAVHPASIASVAP